MNPNRPAQEYLQHKPEAAKQVWRDEITLLMKHDFTRSKREIKASFKEERKAVQKGGSDLPSVRKELASKRDRIASEASKRGPENGKVKVGGGGSGSKRGSGPRHPVDRDAKNARKAGFKKNAGAHTLPRGWCAGVRESERERAKTPSYYIYRAKEMGKPKPVLAPMGK